MRAINLWKNDLLILLVIFLFAFGVRYVSLMDQGITWDETIYASSGAIYANNLVYLNFDHDSWNSNIEHPPFGKLLYGIAIRLFNDGIYDYRALFISKAFSAVMGSLTCALVYVIGREFFDRKAGVAGAIILALIPVFVAHNQQASIDTPLALIFTITVYLFMMWVKKSDWRYFAASALSTGVLVDTKLNGLIVLPVLALFYVIYRYEHRQAGAKLEAKNVVFTLARAAYFLLLAGLTLYVLWPWIWNSPTDLMQSLDHWSYTPSEYFLGTLQEPTPIYYPVYFLVTTPALLLIPFFIGAYSLARSKDSYKYGVLLWCFMPFLYGFSNMVQDGMRYLLMIYPAVALICAAGLLEIAGWCSKINVSESIKKSAFPVLAALTALYLIISLATVYPYYLDYYNALSGGPANVEEHRLFEFGWWGEGIYDSVTYLEHNAAPRSIVYLAAQPAGGIGLYGRNNTYESADSEYFGAITDYVLVNTYAERYTDVRFEKDEYKLVYETKVQGVPIVKVYKNIHII